MIKNVGFLGLGTVGRHMATNLLKGSYKVTVYDSDASIVEELGKHGALPASTPREAAKGVDMVIYVRPEKERLRPDIYGPNGIFAGIDPGTVARAAGDGPHRGEDDQTEASSTHGHLLTCGGSRHCAH